MRGNRPSSSIIWSRGAKLLIALPLVLATFALTLQVCRWALSTHRLTFWDAWHLPPGQELQSKTPSVVATSCLVHAHTLLLQLQLCHDRVTGSGLAYTGSSAHCCSCCIASDTVRGYSGLALVYQSSQYDSEKADPSRAGVKSHCQSCRCWQSCHSLQAASHLAATCAVRVEQRHPQQALAPGCLAKSQVSGALGRVGAQMSL